MPFSATPGGLIGFACVEYQPSPGHSFFFVQQPGHAGAGSDFRKRPFASFQVSPNVSDLVSVSKHSIVFSNDRSRQIHDDARRLRSKSDQEQWGVESRQRLGTAEGS